MKMVGVIFPNKHWVEIVVGSDPTYQKRDVRMIFVNHRDTFSFKLGLKTSSFINNGKDSEDWLLMNSITDPFGALVA